jgi:hypothetical protein
LKAGNLSNSVDCEEGPIKDVAIFNLSSLVLKVYGLFWEMGWLRSNLGLLLMAKLLLIFSFLFSSVDMNLPIAYNFPKLKFLLLLVVSIVEQYMALSSLFLWSGTYSVFMFCALLF